MTRSMTPTRSSPGRPSRLAARRKGALIVVPRRDSIFDLTTKGTIVDARISVEMLEAIFTGSSPLHDGAVIVDADRLARAGVVLPLATETEDTTFGTRHRAAIGLAQASDALIVCVSEERGTVHLAVGNAMKRDAGPGPPARQADEVPARSAVDSSAT